MAEIENIGPHHRLLGEFRKSFRQGLLESKDGLLLALEGPRMLSEAIRSGLRLEAVLFSHTGLAQLGDKLLPQLSKHTQACVADDGAFARAMHSEHPQGVAALARYAPPGLEAVFGNTSTPPLVVAAAGLQDPGNLGTLIRAADAFAATGVVVLADSASPYNSKAVRASAGSLFHLPVVHKVEVQNLIDACRERLVRLLAADARPAGKVVGQDLTGPACLLIGQEAAGVPRALLRAADGVVAIPMPGRAESLNAGVAAAILLYEAARQRQLEAAQ